MESAGVGPNDATGAAGVDDGVDSAEPQPTFFPGPSLRIGKFYLIRYFENKKDKSVCFR